MVGIAASDSTQTSTADGVVSVYMLDEGDVVLACKATTSTNFDADSEIKALEGDRVLFDLISTAYTVDENAGDTATSGLQIIGGNAKTAEVYFKVRPSALQGPVA